MFIPEETHTPSLPIELQNLTAPIEISNGLVLTSHVEVKDKPKEVGFKFESHDGMKQSWLNSISDKVLVLNLAVGEGFQKRLSKFAFPLGEAGASGEVDYVTAATGYIANPMGVNATMSVYVELIDKGLTLAEKILTKELSGMIKLIAYIMGNKEALTSRAIPDVVTSFKLHTDEVIEVRKSFEANVTTTTSGHKTRFGDLYVTMKDWREVTNAAVALDKRLDKLNLPKLYKDVQVLNTHLDKLLSIVKREATIPENIDLYSKLIEESSINIAFAGGVVQMANQLAPLMDQHNAYVQAERAATKKKK